MKLSLGKEVELRDNLRGRLRDNLQDSLWDSLWDSLGGSPREGLLGLIRESVRRVG